MMQSCSSSKIVSTYNMITGKTTREELARLMLSRHVPFTHCTIGTMSALAVSAIRGNTFLIKALGEIIGFRLIDCVDKEGFTALHLACHLFKKSYFDSENVCIGVKELIELGAKVNTINIYGHSPLTSSIFLKNKDLTNLLLQNIFKPNGEKLNLLLKSKIDGTSTLSILPTELIDIGTHQSTPKAIEYFSKGAELGCLSGHYNLEVALNPSKNSSLI